MTSVRGVIELLLRAAGIGLLALLLWRSLPRASSAPGNGGPQVLRIDEAATLLPSLVARATDGPLDARATRAMLDRLPTGGERAALAALRHAGHGLTWTDSTAARGLAVDAVALADPAGRVLVGATAGTGGAPLVLRDSAGILDSTSARRSALLVRSVEGAVEARTGGAIARAAAPPPVAVRRILVYARPGWEAKFAMAALEEAGWQVDGTLPVTARASVTIGTPRPLDTARYAAAVVLDSGVARAATLDRFARAGGGVLVLGDALADAALASLLPARISGDRPAVPGALLTAEPMQGLELLRLVPHADAVVLSAERGGAATVVARRGSGRVLASGYRQSWRWRMEGDAGAMDAHRAWWNALVRTVAYAPPAAQPLAHAGYPGDAAPYADLVARLGPAAPALAARSAAVVRSVDSALLLSLAFAALVLEWASRRTRGAR